MSTIFRSPTRSAAGYKRCLRGGLPVNVFRTLSGYRNERSALLKCQICLELVPLSSNPYQSAGDDPRQHWKNNRTVHVSEFDLCLVVFCPAESYGTFVAYRYCAWLMLWRTTSKNP